MKVFRKTGRLSIYILLIIFYFIPISCSTGIESTKRIELSRQEKKTLVATEEEKFMSGVNYEALKDWKPGKKFLAADDKTALIFEASGLPSEIGTIALGGKTLYFKRTSHANKVDGSEETVLIFDCDGTEYIFHTGKRPEVANEVFKGTDLPLTIDMDLIDQIRDCMKDREFWVKTAIWYDSKGERIAGRKFVKVRIEDVLPGNMVFPVSLKFKDESGQTGYMFMNYGNNDIDSRNFASLFSLVDYRNKYPDITDENWALIQRGRVRAGMTKLECKLSLGNPSEVSSGHDWNNTMDIWQYGDGVFLRFRDGLLVDFRR